MRIRPSVQTSMPRHSHQDAVDETTYERLLDAAATLHSPYDAECTMVLICGGRLGMRAGEICHLREAWVDWDRDMIEIPSHDPCDKGKDGGPCGYCRVRARSAVEWNDNLELVRALDYRWEPKTSNSVRSLPFDFSERVEATIRAFFDQFDRYEHSRASVNRRVDRVLEAAEMPQDTCYPHSLRATAASHHAYRGLPAPALQSMFGWANLSVAQKYLRLSGGATAKALRETHSSD